ncbi:translocation/assembly module TamB domain-containing protein [Nodosilinea sp. LEGE 07088]|uniref:translocation/assembly module TamB domain-containing protein n=1 Tax=Nodosilinea sp. LEGE 07088 TaxID=2777968 RepID=UPI00187F62DE|nr:translocation/assembly module TamB domain-containing protein [Nodosilinea sp. LEGE 07088]MBE9137589.1 translocation/assembly module TamB domain-containing protein [Nodosilinea sp. LEGE 07088]
MTPSQEPEPAQESSPGGRWRWRIVGWAGSGLLLVGSVAGFAGWVWSRNNLIPWLSNELSEALDRPVELGPLERLGPTGIRVGASALPPTATDPDTLTIGAIEVRFNPFDLLRREVRLMIYLEQAEAYLEQAADGEWVATDLDLPEDDPNRDPFIDVSLGTLSLRDSRLTLLPYGTGERDRPQIALVDVQGEGEFSHVDLEVDPEGAGVEGGVATQPQAQRIDLTLAGTSVKGGDVVIKGSLQLPPNRLEDSVTDQVASPQFLAWVPPRLLNSLVLPAPPAWASSPNPAPSRTGLQGKLNLRAQKARATDIMPLVESFLKNPLPVQFPTGLVSGSVDIELGGERSPSFMGTAQVSEGTVAWKVLPERLENLQGDVRFRGRVFEFEDVTASMGELTARASGPLDLDGGYDFSGQVNPFTVAQASDLFGTALPVPANGTFGADVTMTGPLKKPTITTALIAQDTVTIDQVAFTEMRVNTTLAAPNVFIDSIQAIPQDGGEIAGSGQFTFGQPGQLALTLRGDRLPGDAIGRLYGLPASLVLGPVFVEAEFSGPVNQLVGNASWRAPQGTYPAQGFVALADNTLQFTDTFVQVAGGTVAGRGTLGLGDRRWQSTLVANGLQLNQLGISADGVVNGTAQLAGILGAGGLNSIQGQGIAQAVLAEGTVLTQADLAGGQWSANLRSSGLAMAAFAPDLQGTAEGEFRFTGTTANLSPAGIRGQGQLVLSDGLATVAARAPQLAQVRQPLTADLVWNGQSVLVQQASTAGIQVSGLVTPQLSGAGAPAIANLDLNLNVDGYSLAALPVPEVIPLQGNAFFQGRLRGRPGALALNGEASLVGLMAGELAFVSPLDGPVTYTQGGPLAVDLTGGGDRVYVASGQGDRDLDFEVRGGDALARGHIQGDDLYATVANLPLSDIRLPQGETSGFGTVSGLITAAEIVANLRQPTVRASFDVQDPSIGYLSLPTETVVANAGSVAPESPANGNTDRPREMETRYGRLRGTVTYADGVVGLVGGVIESASGLSRYLASGTYTLGNTPQLNGELTIDNGQIQEILQTFLIFERADFRLNVLQPPPWFRPATEADLASLETVQPVGDRNASLLDQLRWLAEVQQLQDSLAAQAETARLPPLEEFVGSISGTVTANGAVPDDLEVTFDLAGANWVWGNPNGSNGSVYRIDQAMAQGSYQDSVIRLEPISLQSDFSDFSATTQQGVAVATLNGDFSFNPDDPVARTLRLEISDVPVQALRQPLRLPNNLNGLMNLGATLTGTLANPQVRGQLAVNEATINRQSIDLATATFGYADARFSLISRLAIDEQDDDPLRLVASVPLSLPGLNQRPKSDDVAINLRMRDEGFALINLLTQAITWEEGQADLALAVQGRWLTDQSLQAALTTLTVAGNANFDGVTISARSLPEPLTNIRGNIQVVGQPDPDNLSSVTANSVYNNGLVLDVQNLQGDFSDGQITAQGNLKLLPSVRDLAPGAFDGSSPALAESSGGSASPLQITLDQIALDLRSPTGTYRGGVDGDVVVDGSVFLLPPLVSGEVNLSNGILTLPESQIEGRATETFVASQEPSIFTPIPPILEDLKLVLDDNIRLAVPGFVDVQAQGTLDLLGTVPNIKPRGRIDLPSGRINLLTTEFRLTGNDNYAEFRDLDEAIDPYLVATLTAIVPDNAAAGNSLAVATPFPRNEISESIIDQLGLTQGGVQTVRIRAEVNGRVSRVVNLQDVELSSTPARSQNEIIALVSGGFLAALESTLGSVSGGGDGFQGLLAFAGSALLNNLQGFLGAGLERIDLRLYSASPPGIQDGAIDIGGELGFNLSPSISLSVQKVFTNVTPAIFGIRYRVNDQITVRAITSYEQFNENTGVVLEFGF